MLKLTDGRPYSFLLESVEGGAVRGRYSIIGTKPDLVWRCHGKQAEINRRCRIDRLDFQPEKLPTLESLRSLLAETRIDVPDELPPMAAGLFGFLAYDMIRLVEPVPETNPDRIGLPDAVFLRPTLIAIFDNIKDIVTIVTPVYPEAGLDADRAYDLALERLADAVADMARGIGPAQPAHAGPPPEAVSNMTREGYHRMVERAKAYILAGDIFQV
ncbi:MAG: anthranilate synthase component I, partial [Geminicoccaceae bacterium]|nr:anthranilate synthase component I [Geminicoccaceae bacterium]